VCVCVCVRERERERVCREVRVGAFVCAGLSPGVCVYVYVVCVREGSGVCLHKSVGRWMYVCVCVCVCV